jgi:hypothetical protein
MDNFMARLQSFPSDPFESVVFVLAIAGGIHVLGEVMYIAWCIIRSIRAW